MKAPSNRQPAKQLAPLALPEEEQGGQTGHMSLRQLVARAESYEQMPLPISRNLQVNVWVCLAINAVSLLVLPYIIHYYASVYPVQGSFYQIPLIGGMMKNMMNWALKTDLAILPYMVNVNAISLWYVLLYLMITWGMRRPVREPVHWLGWLPAVPSGATVMLTIIPIVVFLLTVVIWAIIVVLVLSFIVWILARQ